MTKFDKTQFNYFGGYLTYLGSFDGQKTYGGENVHPTRIGTPIPQFVARFKYKGPFTKAVFLKELIKNHTAETYFAALEAGKAPLEVLRDANEAWYYDVLNKFAEKNGSAQRFGKAA